MIKLSNKPPPLWCPPSTQNFYCHLSPTQQESPCTAAQPCGVRPSHPRESWTFSWEKQDIKNEWRLKTDPYRNSKEDDGRWWGRIKIIICLTNCDQYLVSMLLYSYAHSHNTWLVSCYYLALSLTLPVPFWITFTELLIYN